MLGPVIQQLNSIAESVYAPTEGAYYGRSAS